MTPDFCCDGNQLVPSNQYVNPCSVAPLEITVVVLVGISGVVRLAGCKSIIGKTVESPISGVINVTSYILFRTSGSKSAAKITFDPVINA